MSADTKNVTKKEIHVGQCALLNEHMCRAWRLISGDEKRKLDSVAQGSGSTLIIIKHIP